MKPVRDTINNTIRATIDKIKVGAYNFQNKFIQLSVVEAISDLSFNNISLYFLSVYGHSVYLHEV